MRLYGLPPSHFTRKVRVLLQELRVPFEFVKIESLLAVGAEHFGNNPLERFPVLEDGSLRLIESDLICEYILDKYNGGAYRPPAANKLHDGQRLAVMNGGMACGVTLLRAKRSGLEKWDDYPFFRQEKKALYDSFAWLEKDLGGGYYDHLTTLDIALMSLAEWAVFREFLPSLSAYPNIERFVARHRDRPSFRDTHPSREVTA